MARNYYSEHLRIVIQTYRELNVTKAHRSEIIRQWRAIRARDGLKPVHDNWVDYVLHHYPAAFRSVKKGSGIWEYLP